MGRCEKDKLVGDSLFAALFEWRNVTCPLAKTVLMAWTGRCKVRTRLHIVMFHIAHTCERKYSY